MLYEEHQTATGRDRPDPVGGTVPNRIEHGRRIPTNCVIVVIIIVTAEQCKLARSRPRELERYAHTLRLNVVPNQCATRTVDARAD